MIKYKITLEVESSEESEYYPEPQKRRIEIESSFDTGYEESTSFFWVFGEDMADAVDAISNILPPQYGDFLEGLKDGLLEKSTVWECEKKEKKEA